MSYQETLSMPGPSGGNSPCPPNNAYDAKISFTNGGNLFPSGTGTTCVASLTAGGNAVANTDYNLQWLSGLTKGCLDNSGTNNKTFGCTANKNYTFIAFFLTGHAPAPGTSIVITVAFS